MFKDLMENLSRNQKIGIMVVLQAIIIVVIVVCVNMAMAPRDYVGIVNENEAAIPDERWEGIKNELWYLIAANVDGADKSDIDDAEVREGTYEETVEGDITTARFLLDIDSLKQTYAVTVSWSDEVELSDSLAIDCPRASEMKYPETVCYGMFNDSYSLDLYLPYEAYPAGYENEDDEPLAPNYSISDDQYEKKIDIMVSACDAEKYKKEALDYLNSVPIDLNSYSINYEINSINVNC